MTAGMEFGLLGPLVVRRAGVEVPVQAGKQRVLLAALLLRPGRIVPVDELAEAMWGPAPPPSARVTIRNYVKRLRIALDDAGRSRISTRPGGYLISVSEAELDVARFDTLISAALAAAAECSWAAASAQAAQALALWRDAPLADVESDLLAARDVPRLTELRIQASETRVTADLELGRHAGVIAELRQLTAAHPVRERLHALLMTALYRDGQQAAALEAYHAARGVLVAELGTEPGPELRHLQQQILAGDPGLARDPKAGGPGLPGAAVPGTARRGPADQPDGAPVRYSLPPDTAVFTGRDGELDRIIGAGADAAAAVGPDAAVAIRVIGGMPGVGKTALAVHAAHQLRDQFPDRQLFIDLRGHTPGQDPVPPGEALAGLLAAVGTDPRSLPADVAGRAGMWRDRMAGQRLLLVLDNAAGSAQVAPLLPGTGGCLVLVTSRRHLADLPGAVPVLLEALPPERSREMFIRLAPRAAGGPAGTVAELTGLAGHLPLAISLLARVLARHPSWSLGDLAAETRASLLTLAAENDSVGAAFEVSWQHLDPVQRQFFRRLGLHPGSGIDGYAAAALAGVPLDRASRLLDSLHGEGLLTETGYRRYGMHDLIRQYAADLAVADPAGDREQALSRLLGYYQYTAAIAGTQLVRLTGVSPVPATPPAHAPDLPDADRALAWARAERSSLVACLDYAARAGQHARLVALTAAMAGLLRYEGPWAEVATRDAAAAAAARQVGDRAGEAGALTRLGTARRMTGDHPGAAWALDRALDITRDLGDRAGQAAALGELAALRFVTADFAEAALAAGEALDAFRDQGDRSGEASTLLCLGAVRFSTGDSAGSIRAFSEALGTFRDLRNLPGQASALSSLGAVQEATGDLPAADRAMAQALGIFRDLGNLPGQAGALGNLGAVRRSLGDAAAAVMALGQALDIFRDLGDRRGQAHALCALGALRREEPDYPAAARDLAQALEIFRDLGDRGGAAETLNETGTLHRLRGDLGPARDSHGQALDLAREIASPWGEACALAGLGRCALAAGDTAAAADGLRQAREIFERGGRPEATAVTAELDELAAAVRAGRRP